MKHYRYQVWNDNGWFRLRKYQRVLGIWWRCSLDDTYRSSVKDSAIVMAERLMERDIKTKPKKVWEKEQSA